MSKADQFFREKMKVIRETGFNDKDFKVRAKWEADNAPAHTVKTFGYVTRYDLSKEFPILTLRSQGFKGAVKECLWIFQKKSTNIKDLGLHIWDSWADENGDLGRTYAYSLREKIQYPEGEFDQVDYLLYQLKNNPMDRRMMLQLFDPHNVIHTKLPPCVMTYLFDVADGKLNMTVIQRSADALAAGAAGGWDEVGEAVLQHMLAQVSGLQVGTMVHLVNNLHVYDRHMQYIDEILANPEYESPKLWINPEVKNFYDFTPEDFRLENYQSTKLSTKFDVAV